MKDCKHLNILHVQHHCKREDPYLMLTSPLTAHVPVEARPKQGELLRIEGLTGDYGGALDFKVCLDCCRVLTMSPPDEDGPHPTDGLDFAYPGETADDRRPRITKNLPVDPNCEVCGYPRDQKMCPACELDE